MHTQNIVQQQSNKSIFKILFPIFAIISILSVFFFERTSLLKQPQGKVLGITELGNIQIDLTSLFDIDGISFDTTPANGNFDSGNSYSADTFPGTIDVGDVSFQMGSTVDGNTNVIGSDGHSVPLPANTATSIQVLAAERFDDSTNNAFIVHYTDSTSETVNIDISFWTNATPSYGETVAFSQDHINTPTTQNFSSLPKIYRYIIPVNNTKNLENIELPPVSGDIGIFAMTIESAKQILDVPLVSTVSTSSVDTTTASVLTHISNENGATITERGIAFSSTNAVPDIENENVMGTTNSLIGDRIFDITDLPDNTLIYVRAFATNSEGTSYGEVLTFTTLPLTPIPTPTPSDTPTDTPTDSPTDSPTESPTATATVTATATATASPTSTATATATSTATPTVTLTTTATPTVTTTNTSTPTVTTSVTAPASADFGTVPNDSLNQTATPTLSPTAIITKSDNARFYTILTAGVLGSLGILFAVYFLYKKP